MEAIVDAHAAKIVFFRLTGPPAAVKGTLALDGQEIGKVFVRRYAVLNVNPGRHELHFSYPIWAGSPEQAMSLECKPAKKYFICYDSSMSLAAIIPIGPVVVYRTTFGLRAVSEEVAAPYLQRFELAFTYGTRKPNQAVEPTPPSRRGSP